MSSSSRRSAFKVYTIGNTLVRVLSIVNNLVLLPLYLHYVGSETYGYWLATGGILAWIGAFDFGMAGMIKQRVSFLEGSNDVAGGIQYFQVGLLVYGILLLPLTVCIYAGAYTLQPVLGFADGLQDVLILAFWIAGASLVCSIIRIYLYAYLQAKLLPLGGVVGAALGQIVNIVVAVWGLRNGFGLLAIALGVLGNQFTGMLVNLIYVRFKTCAFSQWHGISKNVLLDYVKVAPTLFVSRLGSQATLKIEPLLIVIFLKPEIATAYTIAKRLIEVLMGFSDTVRGAVLPGFSHFLGQHGIIETQKLLDRIMQISIALTLIVCGVYYTVNSAFIEVWVGIQTEVSFVVMLLIGLEAFGFSIASTLTQLVGSIGELQRSSVVLLVEAGLRVGLMLAFLPFMGLAGLPLAGILTNVLKGHYSLKRLGRFLGGVQVSFSHRFVNLALFLLSISVALGFGYFAVIPDEWVWVCVSAIVSFLAFSAIAVCACPAIKGEIKSILVRYFPNSNFSFLN